MDLNIGSTDPHSLTQITKYFIIFAWMFFCSLFFSACGVKAGNSLVIGTTSYLREVNAGNEASGEYHTYNEKKQLNKIIQDAGRRY